MSEDNVDVVRDHFAATNERNFRRAMSHYTENVELVEARHQQVLDDFRFYADLAQRRDSSEMP